MFCTYVSNLVILAWTADELSCGQASDWYTHTHTLTDTQTGAMTIPEGQNWPRVKKTMVFFSNPWCCPLKSSPPSAAYMRQWSGSAFVQDMACRLFGTKPLPESMLAYCQLDSWEQISVKFEFEFYRFHSRKCIWNCRLPRWRPFCPGRWVKIFKRSIHKSDGGHHLMRNRYQSPPTNICFKSHVYFNHTSAL